MRNIPMIIKVVAVAAIFSLMTLLLASSASAEYYNSAKIDGEAVFLAKDGTKGAGDSKAANPSDAQRGAGDSVVEEGYTFPRSICFAPALGYGNILALTSSQIFTVCLQDPLVHPTNLGGLPSRDSSRSPMQWLLVSLGGK